MRLSPGVLQSFKFVRSRERIFTASRREGFADLLKTSGFCLSAIACFIGIIHEFGAPTPDMVYDIRLAISPDFGLFVRYGKLAEYRFGVPERIEAIKVEEQRVKKLQMSARPAEVRMGGTY